MGIIHRDIKPDNILIEKNKKTQQITKIQLADFGFAKTLVPGQTLSQSCGTTAFIAPEMLSNEGYDKRVDLWSAGVILYYLVCQDVPFHSLKKFTKNEREDLCEAILTDDLDTENQEFCHSRDVTQDLIQKLLKKNPDERITVDDALDHKYFQFYKQRKIAKLAQKKL